MNDRTLATTSDSLKLVKKYKFPDSSDCCRAKMAIIAYQHRGHCCHMEVHVYVCKSIRWRMPKHNRRCCPSDHIALFFITIIIIIMNLS